MFALSVAVMVNVAVDNATGTPLIRIVPAAALVNTASLVSPVVPPLKLVTVSDL